MEGARRLPQEVRLPQLPGMLIRSPRTSAKQPARSMLPRAESGPSSPTASRVHLLLNIMDNRCFPLVRSGMSTARHRFSGRADDARF
jgi:hypothetical protein